MVTSHLASRVTATLASTARSPLSARCVLLVSLSHLVCFGIVVFYSGGLDSIIGGWKRANLQRSIAAFLATSGEEVGLGLAFSSSIARHEL